MRKTSANTLTIKDIYTASLRLLVPSIPQKTYQTIIDEALRLVKAKAGSLYLGVNDTLSRVSTTYTNSALVTIRARGYTYQVYKSGVPRILNRKEVARHHSNIPAEFRSFILIPLFYDTHPYGVLNLQSENSTRAIRKADLDKLQLFGSIASLAIKKTQAQYQAEKAVQTRDLFISMASHEIKTPLTVINLYVDMLYKRLKNKDPQERQWIETTRKHTKRLIGLVNELLQVDHIKKGTLTYEEVNCSLGETIEQAIADCEVMYPGRKFVFNNKIGQEPDRIIADKNKILQALINVINNASKYSPEKTPVLVTLDKKVGVFRIQVQDKGIGIAKSEIDKVFNTFYKGKNNKQTDGMGLGLSLVKQIVGRYQGNVKISSRLQQGTLVEIELPS